MSVTRPEVAFAREMIRSLARLEGGESRRVNKAIDQFVKDPDHPGLNLHPVKSDPTGRLHTFRASDDLRVLLAKEGNVYVLCEVGHHDDIYERAARTRFVAGRNGLIGLIDVPPAAIADRGSAVEPNGHRPGAADRRARTGAAMAEADAPGPAAADQTTTSRHAEPPVDRPGPLDHWTDAELKEAGLSPDLIAAVRACSTEDDLQNLDVDYETFCLIADLTELTPEEWRAPSLDGSAAAESRLRDAIVRFGPQTGISPLFTPEEVRRIARAPVEEWMIFLHPDQRAIVERRFDGPARLRGAAGTGKTAVALHRAAVLARRFREGGERRPILFTTFISSLPPVFSALYRRLPHVGPRVRVEFVNIDKLARKVCRESGDEVVVEQRDIDAAFHRAYSAVVTRRSPLGAAGFTRNYLRDEIQKVIKGRGIRTLDEYLTIERTGRRARLTEPMRRQVWELRTAWDEAMAERGTIDFADVILRALQHARRRRQPTYAAAIIDEAQDLTLVGLQLVRTLVNGGTGPDRQDGLFIVGDGAQKIYPGGLTLAQAGVEVRGRTTVLRRNYRNSAEIIRAARAVAGDQVVDDLGDEFTRSDAPTEAVRNGGLPIIVRCRGHDQELRFIADEVRRITGDGTIGRGDIAVATATGKQAQRVLSVLQRARIPALRLEDYDGRPDDRVKVGTHFRIKGLEYKVVLLPFLGAGDFPLPRAAGKSPEEYEEEQARAISQLYVAMTRARDQLYVLCSGDPSPTIKPAIDHFDVIEV